MENNNSLLRKRPKLWALIEASTERRTSHLSTHSLEEDSCAYLARIQEQLDRTTTQHQASTSKQNRIARIKENDEKAVPTEKEADFDSLNSSDTNNELGSCMAVNNQFDDFSITEDYGKFVSKFDTNVKTPDMESPEAMDISGSIKSVSVNPTAAKTSKKLKIIYKLFEKH